VQLCHKNFEGLSLESGTLVVDRKLFHTGCDIARFFTRLRVGEDQVIGIVSATFLVLNSPFLIVLRNHFAVC